MSPGEQFAEGTVIMDGQFDNTHTIDDNAPPLQVRQVENGG